MPTSSSEFGVYAKPGADDRTPLDQAEVNELIWQGYQPKAAKAKKAADAADAPA